MESRGKALLGLDGLEAVLEVKGFHEGRRRERLHGLGRLVGEVIPEVVGQKGVPARVGDLLL